MILIYKKQGDIIVKLGANTPIEVIRHLSYVPLAVFDKNELSFVILNQFEPEFMSLLYSLKRKYNLQIELNNTC